MRFPSAKSAGFSALIWGVVVIVAASCFVVPSALLGMTVLGALLVTALMLWVWFGTYYEFREQVLVARMGPFFERIPYDRIKRVGRLRSMASSFALSSDMVELTHGQNYITGTTYVSPKDMEGFLQELRARCPLVNIV